jgi:putative transcriptional regulator
VGTGSREENASSKHSAGTRCQRIVNQTLTRISEYYRARDRQNRLSVLRSGSHAEIGSGMRRLRLKADGRIVELRDGREFPLAPVTPSAVPATTSAMPAEPTTLPAVRDLRRRARLTQQQFAARLGVPVETIRNWEQGKRMPRGPARALLAVIAHAPETVFAALARA